MDYHNNYINFCHEYNSNISRMLSIIERNQLLEQQQRTNQTNQTNRNNNISNINYINPFNRQPYTLFNHTFHYPYYVNPFQRNINRQENTQNNNQNINLQERRQYRTTQNNVFDNLTNILLGGFEDFLNPVPIYPTNEQIQNATEIVNFNDISNNSITQCPIDLYHFENDEQVIRIKQCGHVFRENNLRAWFRNSPKCPVCRYDIRNYLNNNEINSNNGNQNDIFSDDDSNSNSLDEEFEESKNDEVDRGERNNDRTNTNTTPIYTTTNTTTPVRSNIINGRETYNNTSNSISNLINTLQENLSSNNVFHNSRQFRDASNNQIDLEYYIYSLYR